jgi:hypothetical protein
LFIGGMIRRLLRSGARRAVGAPYESSAATDVGGADSDNSAGASGAVYVFR